MGSVTCQIGKIMGLKVVAIAGSDDKVEWLKKEIGVDVAINYKAPDFRQQVTAAGFADVYFDNVGGDILNLMMTKMAMKGRIVLCGMFSFIPTGVWSYLSTQGAISDYSKRKDTKLLGQVMIEGFYFRWKAQGTGKLHKSHCPTCKDRRFRRVSFEH